MHLQLGNSGDCAMPDSWGDGISYLYPGTCLKYPTNPGLPDHAVTGRRTQLSIAISTCRKTRRLDCIPCLSYCVDDDCMRHTHGPYLSLLRHSSVSLGSCQSVLLPPPVTADCKNVASSQILRLPPPVPRRPLSHSAHAPAI